MALLNTHTIWATKRVGAEGASLNRENRILLPTIAPQRVRQVTPDVGVLRAVDADDLRAVSSIYVSSWRAVTSCAVASSAESRADGSVLPRFSARRSSPAQAVALKKYRCGIKSVSSTCDNEHTAASLGQSEVLGVKNAPSDSSFWSKDSTSVRPSFPWWLQLVVLTGKRSKKASECVVFTTEDSRYVFPQDDAWLFIFFFSHYVYGICQLHELKCELTSVIFETLAGSCN